MQLLVSPEKAVYKLTTIRMKRRKEKALVVLLLNEVERAT